MVIEIKIKYEQDDTEADVEWNVDEVLYQTLDNDTEFNRLLNNLSYRFAEIVDKDINHDGH